VGVVDGKHGRRAEQVPCHVPVQTISVGWKRDLPGSVRQRTFSTRAPSSRTPRVC
jgi:hypothetical protein